MNSKGLHIILQISILILLGYFVSGQSAVVKPPEDPASFSYFVRKIDTIYNTLQFNNAYINFNKVEFAKAVGGTAFAYYDRQKNKRYILLNYIRLYEKIWRKEHKTAPIFDTLSLNNFINTLVQEFRPTTKAKLSIEEIKNRNKEKNKILIIKETIKDLYPEANLFDSLRNLITKRALSKSIRKHYFEEELNKLEKQNNITFREYLLKAVIAHEWAHHYLGHIFSKGSVLNERNADILMGRILSQNKVPNVISSYLELLFSKNADTQHLDSKSRVFLISKGFLTEDILKIKNCNDIETLIIKSQRTLLLIEKNELRVDTTIEYNSKKKPFQTKDSLKNFYKQEAVYTLLKEARKYTAELNPIDLLAFEISRTPSSDIIIEDTKTNKLKINRDNIFNKFTDTTSKLGNPISQINPDVINVTLGKTDTLVSQRLNELVEAKLKVFDKGMDMAQSKNILNRIKKLNLEEILKTIADSSTTIRNEALHSSIENPTVFTLTETLAEMLYSKYYINRDQCEQHNRLIAAFKIPFDTTKKKEYKYKLKAIDKDIIFDLTKKQLQLNNGIKYTACYHGKTIKNCPAKDPDFPYMFTTDEGNYFIDKNYFLWTEILGAVSLRDKVFLQRFETKAP